MQGRYCLCKPKLSYKILLVQLLAGFRFNSITRVHLDDKSGKIKCVKYDTDCSKTNFSDDAFCSRDVQGIKCYRIGGKYIGSAEPSVLQKSEELSGAVHEL